MIEKLLKLLKVKFQGELILKDGTPIVLDGDLAVGVKVSVNGPDGMIPLPAGSYELEGGQIITVDADGVVTDIVEQVETPETPDTNQPVEPETETETVEETVPPTETEEPEVETEMPMPDMMKIIEELTSKISELEKKIGELETKTEGLSSESTNLTSEVNLIKEKAQFPKELSKKSNPDVPTTSAKADVIARIRQIKNNK